MSAFLFIMAIDWLMKTVTEQKQTGIRWSLFSVLEDLEFADDIDSAIAYLDVHAAEEFQVK